MSRSARKPNQSKLRFEALEKRMLLSATDFVTVKLDHGSLIIRGTEVANVIVVTEAAGVFTVTGLGTTTINGALATSLPFFGVTKDVKIDLRGGDDALLVSGDPGVGLPGTLPAPSTMLIPRDLKIEMGSGNDQVAVDTVVVGREASINTGAGTDAAAVWFSTIGRDLEVKMGNGGETLGVGGTVVGRNVELKTGKGADVVDIFGLIGFNNGAINRLKVDTEGGNDLVSATLSPADVTTGFDILQLSPTDLAAALADIAALAGVSVRAREAKFETESGLDDVLLANLAISKELNVELGSGNDVLTFDGTTNIYAKATLDGGCGVDTFFGSTVNPKTKIKHFELINPALAPAALHKLSAARALRHR